MLKPKTSEKFSTHCRMAIDSAPGPPGSLRLSVEVGPWMGKCEQPMRAGERAECPLMHKH